jgi:hypothetical protein
MVNYCIFKEHQMTLNSTATATATDTAAHTVPQHHLKAAEHLEHAAKAHKDAAKMHVAGDHKATEQHIQTAREHTSKAAVHVTEAAKKSAATANH